MSSGGTERVLFDAPGPRARRRQTVGGIVGTVVLLAILGWVVLRLQEQGQLTQAKWEPFIQGSTWSNYLLPGLVDTLRAAAIAIVLSMVLALLLAMGRLSNIRVLRWTTGVFTEFFRAVPVLIMMIFGSFFLAYNSPDTADWNPLIAVVAALTLYNGSVIGEVIRNGVASLPAGQREAGLSIGLTNPQVRRTILLPQALTTMLPAIVSQIVVITKDSALGYIILYPELLTSARRLGSAAGNILPAYLVIAVIFILINYLISKFAEYLEMRLRNRGRTGAADTAAVDEQFAGTGHAVGMGDASDSSSH